ncbi:hypothetical protein ASD65_10990 [Microbacterium sp. Root61]|uniref:N-acetylglucosamine-6-phosphate deacetylase n=1 Tax=Microbacterium sp. Root61 TaxID=1736570 RepID=UPI0006F500E8|nr:N-acetylglucosamine-6-phosphate deacetylase [Microbacterium sp. Root61]KRA24894.1 hypothetical protein ASD65_10990 [Microbacterium sp. Root61]
MRPKAVREARSAQLLLFNGTIIAPDRALEHSVTVRNGAIDGYGATAKDHDGPMLDLRGGVVRAGYIDLHCHGGGGAGVYSGDEDDVATTAETHLRRGTTSMLASLTAAPTSALRAAAEAVARSVASRRAPNIVGVHFEGPYLSRKRPGAQPPDGLRDVEEGELEELIAACAGLPVSMTIAPELPGAIAAIRRFAHRVRFFIGHTDATAAEFDVAVDAGAHGVTHLFNAMPPFHHREPGPVARALLDPRVRSEIILDGHHMDDDAVRVALAVAGPRRLMLVTDAMAAAGMTDGDYSLPGLRATVEDGAAYVSGTSTLAGSTLTMDRAVQRLIELGSTPHEVSEMASGNAAELMGWTDRGSLRIGARADFVVTDAVGKVRSVFLAGEPI